MLKKYKNIIILSFFFIFIFLTINHYFSEDNILQINKSRSTYTLLSVNNLPLLGNDTNNIIIYQDDLEEFKKKRKKRIWESVISND